MHSFTGIVLNTCSFSEKKLYNVYKHIMPVLRGLQSLSVVESNINLTEVYGICNR